MSANRLESQLKSFIKRSLLMPALIVNCLFLIFSYPNAAIPDKLTPQQQIFIDAEQAIKSKNWNKFNALEKSISQHPLYSYLKRDQLLANISLSHRQQIEDFLDAHSDEPVARKLRYKWLQWLAKQNHSSLFLRYYRDFGSTQLTCKQLEFRLKTSENEDDIYAQVKKIWLTPKLLPKTCDKLIAQWKKSGRFKETDLWQRILLASKHKNKRLTQYLLNQSPASVKNAGELLGEVIKNPKKLTQINFKHPLTSRAIDIIEAGLLKSAWQDANLTIQVWQQLGKKYQLKQEFSSLKRAISLSLALDQDPKASNWLSSLTDKNDSSVNQWLLSTALFDKDWDKIATLANEFSHTQQDAEKWQYWQAVAETQLGNLEKARQLFAELAKQRHYYGFLAARQLNIPPELSHQAIDFNTNELEHFTNHPAAIRAKEFYQLNRLSEARQEWNMLVRSTALGDQTKLALIAHQWGWQHQAILAFARSKQINDVEKRFPLKYLNVFKAQTEHNQIPLSWAFAITRQESAFKADAISSAGARGLMQLKPSTASHIAKKTGQKASQTSQLLSAHTNIKLGTAHLSDIYNDFSANPVLATAAYNAGKHRVQQWLQKINTNDPLEWIEQIPYKETREYVKNVLAYQLIYAKLTNQPDNFIAQLDKYSIGVQQDPPTSP
ncbi:transglycosylase SLT domain-containing protein [Aliikangiella maris]|uniref:Transglycosylase SLT domain-containing protein n=2 Tax=Aliikangiella maris TaxID=3162458 RepID=A0ABV3MI58_9GAMM